LNESARKAMWAKYHANKKKNPPKPVYQKPFYQEPNKIRTIDIMEGGKKVKRTLYTNGCQNCGKTDGVKTRLGGQKLCKDCHLNRLEHEPAGQKYDRYISMGMTDNEARADSGYLA